MKRSTWQFLLTYVAITLLAGCGVSQKDYDQLKAENEKLKRELEDLKFGADRLLSQARAFFEQKDYKNAKAEVQTLLEKHPTSQQSNDAKILLTEIEAGIKAQQEANEKAKAEKAQKEKERLANATMKMRKKYDDINEITWYRDKSSPEFTNYNGFYAYIGQPKEGKPWMRLAIQYAADDWLFIQKYTIKVDGKTHTITENAYGEIKTDNGSGGIWEWLDRQVGSAEYEIIKAVANGKEVKIRFEGKDYHKDKVITDQQKIALRNVLDAFEALGGEVK